MTNPTKRKASESNNNNNDNISRVSTPSSKSSKQNAKRIRLAGIRNLGNTCFMNSVLQCLSNIQRFTSSVGEPPGGKIILDTASSNGSSGGGIYKRKLMQIANLNDNSKPDLLFDSLRNTMFLLKKSGKSFIVPESLHSMIGKNPRFRGYQQHDAHEFLRYVLDRLDKECLENRPILEGKNTISIYNTTTSTTTTTTSTQNYQSTTPSYNGSKKKSAINSTMIGNIFGGILQNEVVCLVCGTKSHKQDPFLDLSLDIPLQQPQAPQQQDRKSTSKQQQQLSSSTHNPPSATSASSTTSSNNNNKTNSTNINANSSDITKPNNNSDSSNLSCNSTSENTNLNDNDIDSSSTSEKKSLLTNDASVPNIKTTTTTSSSATTTTSTSKSNNNKSLTTSGGISENSSCHLLDCLSSFIELEELLDSELYYCSNCQKKQRSTKRFWIRRLPDVLCLHLKRFRYNNYIRTKIDDYVQFPIQNLDMKRYVIINKHETRGSSSGPTTYDLDAFIEHHGSGTGAGHYTAYCRHDNNWFHCDDSSVTPCDEAAVKLSKAYILFYTRRVT